MTAVKMRNTVIRSICSRAKIFKRILELVWKKLCVRLRTKGLTCGVVEDPEQPKVNLVDSVQNRLPRNLPLGKTVATLTEEWYNVCLQCLTVH